MPRRLLAALLAATAPLSGATARGAVPEAAEAPAPGEYQVKAAFLYHFAQLVDWPLLPDGQPFEIGVLGDDVFGPALEAALAGKTVHERAVRVRRYTALPDPAHLPALLFISAEDAKDAERTLRALGDAPVLTVGEVRGFAERAGMIGFRLTPDGRVAFDINLRRAERSGLRLSSQLLKLAHIVSGP